jgi:S1-C subfamily serine protease
MFFSGITVNATDTGIRDFEQSSDFARKAIAELADRDIITGDEQGNFNPKQNISRAEMTVVIARALDLDISKLPDKATFKDVPKSHWAFPYVEAAYREGIVAGISKDTFGVREVSTREQMSAMLVRALGISEKHIDKIYTAQKITKLTDQKKISSWSRDYVGVALSMRLMSGTSSETFEPKELTSREQAAVAVSRLLDIKLSGMTTSGTSNTSAGNKQIAALEESVVLIYTFDDRERPLSQGSGFAIAKGLFMTNYHVVEGATYFLIIDSTGREHYVQGVVKYDADLDMAVLKTEEQTNIKPVVIGSKNTVNKGDSIFAIGSPQGLQNSISDGSIKAFTDEPYGAGKKLSIIEFNAAITHGNSGGPLFDKSGKVIGIVTAMAEDAKDKYAVAIDHAKPWIDELKVKAFADIKVLNLTKAIEAYWKDMGVEVKDVMRTSYDALEREDLDKFMGTIHKLNPASKNMRAVYGRLFSVYDFDYTIKQIEVQGWNDDSVKMYVAYKVHKSGKTESTDIDVYGYYELALEGEQWKIFYTNEKWVYPEGSTRLTGADLTAATDEAINNEE